MLLRNRRRRLHGTPLAGPSPIAFLVRRGIILIIFAVLLFFAGNWLISLFGGGNSVVRRGTVLRVDDGGAVLVSLEGGSPQRAQDGMKLYAGEQVVTNAGGVASLQFFDGTIVRLDERSDLTLADVAVGSTQSTIDLVLARGTLWISTPTQTSFSGAITRTVEAPLLTYALPSRTEAVITPSSLIVFSAEDLGVRLSGRGGRNAVIGEGQRFSFSGSALPAGDLYDYRSVLDPQKIPSFVERARAFARTAAATSPAMPTTDVLTVLSPTAGMAVTGPTLDVRGKVQETVASVRVNGYEALVNTSDGSFSHILTMSGTGSVDVLVRAFDRQGGILQEVRRTVTPTRREAAVAPPGIVSPAKDGETYRTGTGQLVIRGRAPVDARGIMVNDYRLQLFRSGDVEWSYLASTRLGNLVSGSNAFDVVALDADGNQSAPVRITIIYEPGAVSGVVGQQSSAAVAVSSAFDSTTLPKNAPLTPGVLTVTGPTPGVTHTATGSELLIEGKTSTVTASIWVNDYRLQLYRAGVNHWNYIASTALHTMKEGKNTYVIVARNDKNEILDTMTYTITYEQ